MNSSSTSAEAIDSSEVPGLAMPVILRINRIGCVAIGIPLNLIVLSVIVRSRQLWSPRNIFWLAVTFFNLLALIQSVMELTIFYLYQRSDGSHEMVCKAYSVMVGCPYALLLTALTLATADRYSALAHCQFYQNYVTPSRSILVLFTVVIVVVGGHTVPYWTGILQPQCRMQFDWLVVTLSFHGFLSVISSILQIRLFFFIRSCIRYSSVSNETPSPPQVNRRLTAKITVITGPDGQRLSRLEVKAARTLTVGILPFCLINIPLSVSSVAVVIIREHWGPEYAIWLAIVMLCMRELILLHLIYIPAVFMVQSSEFQSAGKRCCRCGYPNPHQRTRPVVKIYRFS